VDGTDEGERVREVRQDLVRLLVRERHAQEVRLRHVRRLRALDRHVHHVRDAQPINDVGVERVELGADVEEREDARGALRDAGQLGDALGVELLGGGARAVQVEARREGQRGERGQLVATPQTVVPRQWDERRQHRGAAGIREGLRSHVVAI
jgi:hypothetical protein